MKNILARYFVSASSRVCLYGADGRCEPKPSAIADVAEGQVEAKAAQMVAQSVAQVYHLCAETTDRCAEDHVSGGIKATVTS